MYLVISQEEKKKWRWLFFSPFMSYYVGTVNSDMIHHKFLQQESIHVSLVKKEDGIYVVKTHNPVFCWSLSCHESDCGISVVNSSQHCRIVERCNLVGSSTHFKDIVQRINLGEERPITCLE